MLGLNVNLKGMSPPRPPAVGGVARTVISQPRDFAFDFVARDFFKNYQRWCPQVVELEPNGSAPVRVGMTARQVTMERGIRSESTFEIVNLERPRFLALEGISEPFSSSYAFECESQGTTLIFTFELREIEFSMRPFVKLIRAALQDGAEQIVENLRALIETGAASAQPAGASQSN
ncbi:MAG: polyketide cyclase/dehydrase [Methylocystaceae bacterium]|nr:MAG: polyketide cyclase/dehydrase [Methylocystaceae bacterium]